MSIMLEVRTQTYGHMAKYQPNTPQTYMEGIQMENTRKVEKVTITEAYNNRIKQK